MEQFDSPGLSRIPGGSIIQTVKMHIMPNMSSVVVGLRWEIWGAMSIIWLALNSCIRVAEFSAHKGVSAHMAGETSPQNWSEKWPKKQKRSAKISEVAKKGWQRRPTKFLSK